MGKNEEYLDELRKKAADKIEKMGWSVENKFDKNSDEAEQERQVYQIELEIQNDELKSARNQLEQSFREFYNLFYSAPVGYLVLDQYGMIQKVNNAFCVMTGTSHDKALGKSFFNLLYKEEKEIFIGRFKAFYKDPSNKTIETKLTGAEGNVIYVKIEGNLLNSVIDHSADKNSPYLLITTSNITEIKVIQNKLSEEEKKLKEVIRSKDKYFSILAHDLRSPLTGLLNALEILTEDSNDDKPIDSSLLHLVFRSSKRLYRLIDNLLIWSRTQLGIIKFKPQEFDANIEIKNIVDLYLTSITEKGIILNNEVKDSFTINYDKDIFNLIIRNLLSNAIKFTNQGGSINITHIFTQDGAHEFKVADTGVGMSEEQLDDLFTLEKIKSTAGTNKETGSGLGLILCKEFAERHNGSLSVSSKLGEGTEVTWHMTGKH